MRMIRELRAVEDLNVNIVEHMQNRRGQHNSGFAITTSRSDVGAKDLLFGYESRYGPTHDIRRLLDSLP